MTILDQLADHARERVEAAKQYIYLKVRTVFDPPTSGSVLEAYKKQIEELEWRLNVQSESVRIFEFVPGGPSV